MLTILTGVCIFLAITLLLVIILLIAKKYLVHSGKVKITINNDTVIDADSGKPLLSTLADHNIFLPSACGGKGSCGQCKCQVYTGGGDILPTEKVHFSRKEQQDHWRLGCQVKVKEDINIGIPASALDVKEWE
ncbi:MAG: 2Fe-2S iron-sulfur cluster binding domain-containing protein, partial [Duncaniella sp.]|nr:2Fe-2S iron-sulfur cluster binding domain-containing protein [Duncaniella sp.]